jgi:hypothetical protein
MRAYLSASLLACPLAFVVLAATGGEAAATMTSFSPTSIPGVGYDGDSTVYIDTDVWVIERDDQILDLARKKKPGNIPWIAAITCTCTEDQCDGPAQASCSITHPEGSPHATCGGSCPDGTRCGWARIINPGATDEPLEIEPL